MLLEFPLLPPVIYPLLQDVGTPNLVIWTIHMHRPLGLVAIAVLWMKNVEQMESNCRVAVATSVNIYVLGIRIGSSSFQ